ncbi:MAG: metallophosphoesterase family protein [Pirellulaceae bacterium]
MRARTIAIGDIHGCAAALAAVLAAIKPAEQDTLIFLGDFVDRGPDSRGVIEQVLALEKQCGLVTLLGNHEIMFLDALEKGAEGAGWLQYGGRETLASYNWDIRNFPDPHLDFIRGLKRYHETATHFFVHANYIADIPLAEQPDYALFWEHLFESPPAPHENGKTAIVGHTAQRSGEIRDLGHVVCIDTYCHSGGWLTALDVDTGEVWQADRQGRMRD